MSNNIEEPKKKRAKTRIPLPDQRDRPDKKEKKKIFAETLPSALMFTILNGDQSNSSATCATISEDATIIVVGLSDSTIIVWPLTPSNLTQLRPAHELDELDKESPNIMNEMIDPHQTFDKKTLIGHSGPVFSVSLEVDNKLLLSSSEDGSIRLWSLDTWTCLCIYKSHFYPVWEVKFCPHGHYFASCSLDRTARLWATEHKEPLRIFVGHEADVDCVEFHPSSNYIASGSTDKKIKIWDLIESNCIKTLEGHEARMTVLKFSIDGKFLISASEDKKLIFWEHTIGHKLAELDCHNSIISMSFSRCGSILTTGGLDNCINIWDFNKFVTEVNVDELNTYSTPSLQRDTKALMLTTYRTKKTLPLSIHFTRRNLMLVAGVFIPNK